MVVTAILKFRENSLGKIELDSLILKHELDDCTF